MYATCTSHAAHGHAALRGHQVPAGDLFDVLCDSYLYLPVLHTVIKPVGIVGRTCWNTMRLLKSSVTGSNFELTSFDDDLAPPYAILSHTWTENQEVTFDELLKGTSKDKDGYAKIRFCGERAAADGLEYFWVDTCCINKATSDELSTAVNSIFHWYQRAAKCYVLLIDVSVPEGATSTEISDILWKQAFQRSRWFTRGWTLQELLAPTSIKFFSRDGKWLGNKISLEQEINRVTGIPKRQQGSKKVDLQDSSAVLSLPFLRNERFAGRESQLQSMKQILLSPSAHQWLTIYGLGGCGKSALALELAYRAFADQARRLVFWVPAISQESFELAYRDIGTQLRIPGIDDANADVKQLVRDALNSGNLGHWLMIVDNADDSEVLLGVSNKTTKLVRLIDYIPLSIGGSVFFTTRSRKAATDLTSNNVLELNDMDKFKARQLFVHRINNRALLSDETAVDALLEILTGLPLAIVQAATFINQNEISVSEYASLLQHAGTKAKLFSEHFEDPSRYRDMDSTVAKTWPISFEQIQRQDPLAVEYLSFIGCIDCIGIPQSLLPPRASTVHQIKAIETLTEYAFITERR
ncbi:hypothetical protein GGP41_000158 [Bipolaris sorokiniana]|uniref:HET-domain-containing protein n=1 Tax=Cochliobolus sativus TaxID=45130 RepID=A0A8H5ZDV1_COCSA|nr:hypothetical protein GGP41_000158 [Bipolaris sorokiniana]